MYVRHNDEGIWRINSLVFCFFVDKFASGKYNFIYRIASNRLRCPVVAFNGRIKEYQSTIG